MNLKRGNRYWRVEQESWGQNRHLVWYRGATRGGQAIVERKDGTVRVLERCPITELYPYREDDDGDSLFVLRE